MLTFCGDNSFNRSLIYKYGNQDCPIAEHWGTSEIYGGNSDSHLREPPSIDRYFIPGMRVSIIVYSSASGSLLMSFLYRSFDCLSVSQ